VSTFIVTYLKYVGAPTFSFRPALEGGRYVSKRNPRTDLKIGHYKGTERPAPEGRALQRRMITRSGGSGRRGCGWWTGA